MMNSKKINNINADLPLPLGDWYEFFIANFEEVLTGIGNAETVKVIDALHNVLWTSGKAIMKAWGQILLWDENDKISLVLINTGGVKVINDTIRKGLDKLELDLLGKHLKEDWFLKEIPELYKDQVILLRRKSNDRKDNDNENGEMNFYEAQYDLYNVDLETENSNNLLTKNNNGSKNIPTFIDPTSSDLLWRWLENLLVVGAEWPGTADIPKMSGIVAFALDPELGNLDRFLYDNREILTTMAWVVLFPVFVFQTYALSLVSVKEPDRLREELQFSGWNNLLKKISRRKKQVNGDDLQKYMLESFLKNGQIYLVKQVLRKLLKEEVEGIWNIFIKIMSSWLKGNSENEKRRALQLMNLSIEAMDFNVLNNDVIAIANNLILNPNKDVFPTNFEISISSFENVYTQNDKDIRMKHNIIDFLTSVHDQDSISQSIENIDRLILTAFLMAENSSREIDLKQNAINLVINLLRNREKLENKPNNLIERLFVTLDESIQVEIKNKTTSAELNALSDQFHLVEYEINQLNLGEVDSSDINLISVISSKGGVGKSIIALGLGLTLSQNEKNKICVVDLDLVGPTYYQLVGRSSVEKNEKHLYLNDYLWADYIKENEYSKEIIKKEHFRYRNYWWDRFNNLSLQSTEELRKGLLVNFPHWSKNFQAILSSPDFRLQSLIHPFLDERDIVTKQILGLIRWLKNKNYTHIIFDTPAEFKEFTESTLEIIQLYRGQNVFVSTSFGPSLQHAIHKSTTPLTSQTKNYLIINKIRGLDNFAESKDALIDHVTKTEMLDNNSKPIYFSMALGNLLLNFKDVSTISWEESLENFQNPPRAYDSETEYIRIINDVSQGVKPIISG